MNIVSNANQGLKPICAYFCVSLNNKIINCTEIHRGNTEVHRVISGNQTTIYCIKRKIGTLFLTLWY